MTETKVVAMSLEDDGAAAASGGAQPAIPVALSAALVDSYVSCHTVARTHIESMDYWLLKMQTGSAACFPDITPSAAEKQAGRDFRIRFLFVKMEAPTYVKRTATSCSDMPCVPNMARQGNLDYSHRQHIRVLIERAGAPSIETDLFAGRMLTMVKSSACALSQPGRARSIELHRERRLASIGCAKGNGYMEVPLARAEKLDLDRFAVNMGECAWDSGGYFIVHGTEKVVVHQEYRRVNVVSVTDNDNGGGGKLGDLSNLADEVVDETKAEAGFESALSDARVEEEGEVKAKPKKAAPAKKQPDAKAIQSAKKRERKTMLHASFMSQCGEDLRTIVNVLVNNNTGVFCVSIDHATRTMPLFLLLHSLGLESKSAALDMLCLNLEPELAERMRVEMEPSRTFHPRENMTRDEADKYIDKHFRADVTVYGSSAPEDNTEEKRVAAFRNSIKRTFLQHLGRADDTATRMRKAELLCHITRALCLVRWGLRPPDSPDHLQQKSVATSGRLMYVLWLDAMLRAWNDMGQKVRSDVASNDLSVLSCMNDKFNPDTPTSAIRQAVATGQWPAFDYSKSAQSGISQTLERHNLEDYAATMARTVNNLKNTHHAIGPMELHPSSNGMYDPSATSDEVPGLVKQLCTFTHISHGVTAAESKQLSELIHSYVDDKREGYFVMLNGFVIGRTSQVAALVQQIREDRVVGKLYRSTEVLQDDLLRTCTVQMDHGRHIRVLARMRDSKVLMCGDSCDASMQRRYVEIAKTLGTARGGQHRPRFMAAVDARERRQLRETLGGLGACKAASGPCVLHKLMCMKYDVAKQPAERWRYLEAQGYVDQLGVSELWSGIVVARPFAESVSHKGATHGELGPAYLLGPASAVAHMVGHVHTARMLNVNHLARSAIGVSTTNAMTRFVRGEGSQILRYPQQIHATPYAKSTGQNELSNKQQPIVAVMESWGYGQEDAVVNNRSSQERGLGVSDRYRTFPVMVTLKHPKEHIASKQMEWSTIVHPLAFKGGRVDQAKFRDYSLLPTTPVKCLNMRYEGESSYPHVCSEHCSVSPFETTGIATLHQTVKTGQVLVGIVRSFVDPHTKEVRHVDHSFKMPIKNQTGVITKIMVTMSDETEVTIHVTVAFELDPFDGQKFAFSYGQKGVQDVALRQEDMIWTEDGIVPDMIINPHGFPTRTTIHQLIAKLSGKAGLVMQKALEAHRDHDNFAPVDIDTISELLREAGYQSRGNEAMYCPRTGRRLKGKIFIGPVGVHKPPHMPEEKAHARSLGAKTIGTGQPVKGRSMDGGFKFGEMEAKILIIAGASENLLQWLMDNSDATVMPFCERCGIAAVAAPQGSKHPWMCRMCGHDSEVTEVRLPGSAKHLIHILSTANIRMRVFADKKPGGGQGELEDPGNYLDMLNKSIVKRFGNS